jgi:hypothetical protein
MAEERVITFTPKPGHAPGFFTPVRSAGTGADAASSAKSAAGWLPRLPDVVAISASFAFFFREEWHSLGVQ